MELEMGLLCFLTPIFHRGCSPTEEYFTLLCCCSSPTPPALHHDKIPLRATGLLQASAGMLCRSCSDLIPACTAPPNAAGAPNILPAALHAPTDTTGALNSSFHPP